MRVILNNYLVTRLGKTLAFNYALKHRKEGKEMYSVFLVCKKQIEVDKKKGTHVMTQEKLDVFYAGGRLTTDEYNELTELLNEN